MFLLRDSDLRGPQRRSRFDVPVDPAVDEKTEHHRVKASYYIELAVRRCDMCRKDFDYAAGAQHWALSRAVGRLDL
jgi:hypothetical protein